MQYTLTSTLQMLTTITIKAFQGDPAHHLVQVFQCHLGTDRLVRPFRNTSWQTVDLVNNSDAFYATWDAEFELKVPGREGIMEGRGIAHCVRKDGKVSVWTMYEDPTPFVEMAMKRQKAQEPGS